MQTEQLAEIAKTIRVDIINMLAASGHGHPGGSLSCADILTVLYFSIMNIRPEQPDWNERDRFILSKGHAAPALYGTLMERGFLSKKQITTLHQYGSILQGHPDMNKAAGVDMSTGSLGQGLSVGNGMALSAKLKNKKYRVYVLLGDGEIQEGQVWEAAMTSAHYHLDNVTAVLDNNGLQIDGTNDDIMKVESIEDKFQAFGWMVIRVDGHNLFELNRAFLRAQQIKGKPTIIIAKTVKGKGVSFMENKLEWHGKAPTAEQAEQALIELKGSGLSC